MALFRGALNFLLFTTLVLLQTVALHNVPAAPSAMADSEATGSVSGHAYQADGGISGTVTKFADGTPISDVHICFRDMDTDQWYECSRTDEAGEYRSIGLPAGTYRAEASAPDRAWQYYRDKLGYHESDPVVVVQGETTAGIDFRLSPGGKIEGRVTAEDGVTPLEYVHMDLFGPGHGWGTCTDSQGRYSFSSIPLEFDYRVRAASPEGGCGTLTHTGHAQQYFPGVDSWDEAMVFSVNNLTPAYTGIDFELEPIGSISGHVFKADGTPISDVEVCFWGYAAGDGFGCARTDQVGSYMRGGLPSGTYRIQFTASGWAYQYYDEKLSWDEADPVVVTAGEDTPGINARLQPGGGIEGHVYSADDGSPLADIPVSLDGPGHGWGTCTDTQGSYEFAIVPLDYGYRVRAAPPGARWCGDSSTAYAQQYYQDASKWEDADILEVTQAMPNFSGIDFQLAQAGAISGHVHKADGTTVINDAQISIHAHGISSGSSSLGTYASQTNGSYTISGLVPGSYKVQVNNNLDPAYQTKYYDDKGAFENAYIILIAAGETTQDIDFRLEENASIEVDAGGGMLEHTTADGATTTVQVPANAVTETLSLVYEPKGEYPAPEDGRTTGPSFRLAVQDDDGPVEGFTFLEPITIQVEYTDEDLVYSNEDEVLLYLYVYETNSWVDAATTCDPPSEYTRLPNQNTIAVDICHLSYFGVFGPDEAEYTRLPALQTD